MSDRQQRRESNERSRRIHQQTIGSHVRRESQQAKHTKVSFGNQRRQTRAVRGEITQVAPSTTTAESSSAYSRRSRSRDYLVTERRQRKRRTRIIIVVAVVAAIALVWNVASFVYGQTVDGKMRLNDNAVTSALTAPASASDAYWVLLTGEYDAPGPDEAGPDLIELVRVDPQRTKITYMAIPCNTRVSAADGKTYKLREIQANGGDADLIAAVKNMAGVKIAHFAKVNADGFRAIMDVLGGVTVDLAQEIDDPYAGTLYLKAGEQKLDADAAFVAVRATNYTDALATQAHVQADIMQAMLKKMLEKGGLDSAATFDAIASDFKTDIGFTDLSTILAPFGKGENITFESTVLPGSISFEGDNPYYRVSSNSLSALVKTIESGESVKSNNASNVDASKVKVAVRNGSSITGAAAQAAAKLMEAGFEVPETGNTDTPVYTETLIIYRGDAGKDAAEAVATTLGQGRMTSASIYYTFDTDILVIIGANWVS